MKKTTLTLLITSLHLCLLNAQDVFQRIYNLGAQSVINLDWYASIYDIDSGYIAAASISSPSSGASLLRLNKNGTVNTATAYDISPGNIDATIDVLPLPDQTIMHNVYAGGGSILIKSDYAGALYTARQLTPTFASTIYKQLERNGFIYGAGRGRYNNTNGGMLVKMDLEGNPIDARFFAGPPDRLVTITGIIPTADGGFVLSGIRQIYGVAAPSEMLIFKTDSLGNLISSKQIGTTGALSLQPVQGAEATDGTLMFIVNNAGGASTGLLKTDNFGNAIWYKTFSNPIGYKPTFYNITHYGTNEFIVIGNIDSSAYASRPMYMILDYNGNVTDAKLYAGVSKLVSSGNYYQSNKGLLMFGFKNDPANYGYFLYKTDLNLNAACQSVLVNLSSTNQTTTDSVIAYTSSPYIVGVNDVGANITQSSFILNDYDLCPAVTGVNVLDTEHFFKVIVNSSKRDIKVLSDLSYDSVFKIFDISGKEVKQVVLKGAETTISTLEIKPGIYFYGTSGLQKSFTGKIILQ